MNKKSTQTDKPTDIEDGLMMRRSTAQDGDPLSEFYLPIFTNPDGSPNSGIPVWVKDLLNGRHPTFDPADFSIVEDIRSRKIVSALNLIPLRWTYRDIPLSVGQIEVVATDPAYRRRGLVRAQIYEVHG
jgi:hypothetical protein